MTDDPDYSTEHDRRVTFHGRERTYNGFFKIDKLTLSHEGYKGEMIGPRDWEVFERGDSVGVLLFNRDTSKVVLVEQFRPPVYGKSRHNGWMVELIAGMTRESESCETTASREVLEEAGFRIPADRLEKIDTFFSSPGGTSERIYLYFGEVQESDRDPDGGGGIEADAEIVRLVELELREFFERLDRLGFEDPKVIIAGYWLKNHIEWERARGNRALDTATVEFVGSPSPDVPDVPSLTIGYKTGDISKITDVDIWVNSESTDMEMDKLTGLSVSSSVRTLGAKRNAEGCIVEDIIGNDLNRQKRGHNFFAPGTVIETRAGALEGSHNVKRLLHVASYPGEFARRFQRDLGSIGACVENILKHANTAPGIFRRNDCDSVLIPILATGEGGFDPEDVIPVMIAAVVDFVSKNPKGPIRKIYFAAYSARHRAVCERVLVEDYGRLFKRKSLGG
ncbi:MAG: hypothetical protein RLZ98_2189 [Pseudomonadota bacterium]|jgi:ADP-ribose pyrophosphatase